MMIDLVWRKCSLMAKISVETLIPSFSSNKYV
jgi:hypothetical protein